MCNSYGVRYVQKHLTEHWLSWGFNSFPSVPPCKCHDNTLNQAMTLWNCILYNSLFTKHATIQCLIASGRSSHTLQNSRSHPKILGTWKVTWNTYHTEDTKMICTTIQNLVARVPGICSTLASATLRIVKWTINKNKTQNWWGSISVPLVLLFLSFHFLQYQTGKMLP